MAKIPIHQIYNQFTEDKPKIKEALSKLQEVVDNNLVIEYSLSKDVLIDQEQGGYGEIMVKIKWYWL